MAADPDLEKNVTVAPSTCPEGPHREPQGPNEDVAQCPLCWSLSWTLRPAGETFGLHLPDCSLPPRHTSYCQPGGNGHPPAELVRGFTPHSPQDTTMTEDSTTDAVTELTEASTGRWIVTTHNGTQHLFDLDERLYARSPSAASRSKLVVDGELVDSGGFNFDGQTVPLTSVERWPTVDGSFLIWLGAEWRQSSQIVSITPAPAAPATGLSEQTSARIRRRLVSPCRVCGVPAGMGLCSEHWDHIDEAEQDYVVDLDDKF